MDVGVHREEEPGRGVAPPAPEAEVEVVRPDDPPEEEVRPLAGAPVAGGGEEEEESARRGARENSALLPEGREEAVEGRDEVGPAVVAGGEERGEGALGAERRSEGPEEGAEGSNVDPPVHEPVEAREGDSRVGEGSRRAGAEDREETLERGAD